MPTELLGNDASFEEVADTFCSWLAMAGASIKEIQELAGHKTITMSARYSHLSPEHRLSVIDRIVTGN
jgi:site-specific recombinase XerD